MVIGPLKWCVCISAVPPRLFGVVCFILIVNAGYQIQGTVCARQVLYHWATHTVCTYTSEVSQPYEQGKVEHRLWGSALTLYFLTVRLYLPAALGALRFVLFGIEWWYPSQPNFSWYVLGSSYMENKLKQRNHKTMSAMMSWGTARERMHKAVRKLSVWRSRALEYSALSPLLTPEAQCAGLVSAAVLNTMTESDLWRKGLFYFTG